MEQAGVSTPTVGADLGMRTPGHRENDGRSSAGGEGKVGAGKK